MALKAAHTAADEAAAQNTSLTQLVATLQADKASLAQQIKKLTADKASLSEQLGSSAGDIDMLQVRCHCLLHRIVVRTGVLSMCACTACQQQA